MMINQEQQVDNQKLEDCSSLARGLIWNQSSSVTIAIFFNIVLNVVLMITASLGNGMIIVAILRSQNLQTPSYLLITSLAFTDLLTGLVFHPLQIALSFYNLQDDVQEICAMAKVYVIVATYITFTSLLLVTCISIDRYLALTLRHRYNIVVTKKRVRLLVFSMYVLSLLIAFPKNSVELDRIFAHFGYTLALILVTTSIVFYIRSYRALHHYTAQVHAQQPNPLAGNFDVVRYKRTLKTMVLVLACLLICSVPIVSAVVASAVVGSRRKVVVVLHVIAATVISLNSSLNPVIYLVRFADIRNACRETIKSFICH